MIRAAALACVLALPAGAGEFTTLKGHGGPVMALDVHPDGRVVTGSFDNAVGVWDGRTPEWRDGHEAAVTVVAVLPDGRIASGGDDFAVRVWGGGDVVGRHEGKVTALAAMPDGTLVSGSWDGTVRVWREDGPVVHAMGGGVNAVAAMGDALLVGTTEGTLLRLDPDGATVPLVRHGFGINRIVVGEGWIAYGAVDGVTRVIDPEGEALADFTLDRRPILSMAHHPGTARLAVGDGDGYVMVLDTALWDVANDFRAARQGPVWALAYAPDGATLYAGGLDDAAYAWPVDDLDAYEGAIDGDRTFLADPATMSNGERQFARKCSICHELTPGPSRRAGPTLHGLFGRIAGTVEGYSYSGTLDGSAIVWDAETIDALFDQGPDHYIPGSKMPMQLIAGADDRADLIDYLREATQ